MHVHVAVGRHLGEPIGKLTKGNQPGSGDVPLLVLPRLANVDENGRTTLQRIVRLGGADLRLVGHARSVRGRAGG